MNRRSIRPGGATVDAAAPTRTASTSRMVPILATIGIVVGMLVFVAAPAAASSLVVDSLGDAATAADGSCTLREAIGNANADTDVTSGDCPAGSGTDTITFSVSGTITLSAGALALSDPVTIDGSTSAGITISGNNADRVFVVNAGVAASVRHVTVTGGLGWQIAGAVLDNGDLTLDHVVVSGNTMETDAGDYWQGGGGVYVGGGGTLTLRDSTVSGNSAGWSGGAIYAFTNSTTTIVRSTISGNVSNDTGGAIRSLGDVSIVNSTITGNTATGWHGGAIFHTDGAMTITSSTIAANIGPDWAPSAIFVGNFSNTTPPPSLALQNSIVAGNQWYACERWGSGGTVSVSSAGYNLVQDDTCGPVSTDVVVWDAGLGSLADNGGPTQTMALLSGSAAIDAIPAGTNGCGTTIITDQRGWVRPPGTPCDVGAFEVGAGYAFTGYLAPVDNPPTLNKVKAGSAVPVRFSLGGDQGLDIFAQGYPTSEPIACEQGTTADAIEQTVSAGSSSLSYDAATDTYTYVWKTQKGWRGTCRQFVMKLDQGPIHVADFQFK